MANVEEERLKVNELFAEMLLAKQQAESREKLNQLIEEGEKILVNKLMQKFRVTI